MHTRRGRTNTPPLHGASIRPFASTATCSVNPVACGWPHLCVFPALRAAFAGAAISVDGWVPCRVQLRAPPSLSLPDLGSRPQLTLADSLSPLPTRAATCSGWWAGHARLARPLFCGRCAPEPPKGPTAPSLAVEAAFLWLPYAFMAANSIRPVAWLVGPLLSATGIVRTGYDPRLQQPMSWHTMSPGSMHAGRRTLKQIYLCVEAHVKEATLYPLGVWLLFYHSH